MSVISDNVGMDATKVWANVTSTSDYYAFGMVMPGRSYTSASYRYGYNGKEKDVEGMGGGGSTYDYGFRIYNPRIGKFLSVDPLTSSYPWYTPYQFAGNTPIAATDLDGLEEDIVIKKTAEKTSTVIVKRTAVEVSKKMAVNSAGELVEIGTKGFLGTAGAYIGAFLAVIIPSDQPSSSKSAAFVNRLSDADEYTLKNLESREFSSEGLTPDERLKLEQLREDKWPHGKSKSPFTKFKFDQLMKAEYEIGVDCSEIAEEFQEESGGEGIIYNITAKDSKKEIVVKQDGFLEAFGYHQVFELDGKIYDPRYSKEPVSKDKYFKEISNNNPGGFNVENITKKK